MEPVGAWLNDEEGYRKYIRSINEFNYKVFTGQINHNNSYLGYVLDILLYYRFGKNYADTDEKFHDFLTIDLNFRKNPYNTVMEIYRYWSQKGAIPYDVHREIQETLQWLVEPYNRSFDEYDQFHVGKYCKLGQEWIKKYYKRDFC